MSELVVYRAREFPEYHQWVSKILRVSEGRLMVIQECADVLSVIAAVESGRGAAVVGEFITAVAGDRVRFVPFVSEAHFLEVGLLYQQGRVGENLRKLVAVCSASKQPTYGRPHKTENKVRLGLQGFIGPKENAPEFDYSRFYRNEYCQARTRDQKANLTKNDQSGQPALTCHRRLSVCFYRFFPLLHLRVRLEFPKNGPFLTRSP
jgi:hypothetical protein